MLTYLLTVTAAKLAPLVEQHSKELLLIMRVYFEKPRTTVGWKGLINDPGLDGSYHINKGLRIAREVFFFFRGKD